MKPHLLAVIGVLAFAGLAQAQNSGDITVKSAWSRATPAGAKTGVIYLTLANTGAAEDKLIGAATPVADKAQLHSNTMNNGVMEMRPLASLAIKPGGKAVLKPGGNHLMLTGLKQQLKAGDFFTVTLEFEHAGKIETQVSVAKAGAVSMSGQDMDNMNMDDMKH